MNVNVFSTLQNKFIFRRNHKQLLLKQTSRTNTALILNDLFYAFSKPLEMKQDYPREVLLIHII